MITVNVLSWVSFANLLTVQKELSRYYYILTRMMSETGSFMLMLGLYFTLVSLIFTTLFQLSDRENYGSLTATLRTLFDAFIGQYRYLSRPNEEFSALMIFHLIASNIFLMNFLISMLNTTYIHLSRSESEKHFLKVRYEYLEQYYKPLQEKEHYILTVLPCPLNLLTFPFMPLAFKKSVMQMLNKALTSMIYWIENAFLILGYTLVLLCLSPYVYFKALRFQKSFLAVPIWALFLGPPCLVYLLITDVGRFLQALLRSSSKNVEDDDKDMVLEHDMILIFNELATVFHLLQNKS
jgi:hypothetical protein